jgi:branched-chain amino acid transport system permease protein
VIVQLGVDCLAASALYALIALAVALAFSGSGTVHLAIGQVAVTGALTAAALVSARVPLWLAWLAGLAVAAAVSGAVEAGLVAPALGRPVLGAVLLVATAVVLREVLQGLFPHPAYAFPIAAGTLRVLGGIVHVADVLTIGVVAATALAVGVVLRSSLLGAALRVTAAAPAAAERIGVDTARVRLAAFAIAGALAGVAVLLGAGRFPLSASGGAVLALRGIATAAAGSMRSPVRVVAAAVVIAAAEVVGGFYLGGGGEFLSDAVAVLLIAAAWRR